jgi:hypothetical protein
MEQWRPHLAWDDQPPIDNLMAVTSLSPKEKHQEVQLECLASWKLLGIEKIVNAYLEGELSDLAEKYPEMEWHCVAASQSYETSTPRIYDLMQLAKGWRGATLIINSDIALYGYQSRLVEAIKRRKPTAFIRHNWEAHPGRNEREKWGIDAFLLFPEHVASFPNLDFAIGQPMWDYWIPYHLSRCGIEMDWVGDPYLFHRTHPVHWKPESVSIGQGMLQSHYGTDVAWEQWRKDQPFGG